MPRSVLYHRLGHDQSQKALDMMLMVAKSKESTVDIVAQDVDALKREAGGLPEWLKFVPAVVELVTKPDGEYMIINFREEAIARLLEMQMDIAKRQDQAMAERKARRAAASRG